MTRYTPHSHLPLVDYDDPAVIATAYNDAMDHYDTRVGRAALSGWESPGAGTAFGFTTSVNTRRMKKMNKTIIIHDHMVIATATSTFEVGFSGTIMGMSAASRYEVNNSTGDADMIGRGVAFDTSAGLRVPIWVGPSGINSNRLEFHLSAAATNYVSNTVPFTWAAGDVLSYTLMLEFNGDAAT